MSVNKHPRLYVRVKGEELRRWHEWSQERRRLLTDVIQHVFRKGRLPRIPPDLASRHLSVELTRVRFYVVRIRNNLKQVERLLVDGTVDGDLAAIRAALKQVDAAIAELNNASDEVLDLRR